MGRHTLTRDCPAASAGDIAHSESETIGLGATDEATLSQLQPLTNEAAGVFAGRSALGRKLPPGLNIRTVMGGQRLYHLAIKNRRPLTVRGLRGRTACAPAGARVRHARPHSRMSLRVCIFFSEVKAQRLAVRLRQQSHAGSLTVGFQKLLSRRLPPILHGKRRKPAEHLRSDPRRSPGSASDSYLATTADDRPHRCSSPSSRNGSCKRLPSSSELNRRSSFWRARESQTTA